MWVVLTLLALLRVQFVISTTLISTNETLLFGSWNGCEGGGKYKQSIANLLAALSVHASSSNTQFYNSSFGQAPNQLYGQYLCRGDIDGHVCSDCVNYARRTILKNRSFGTQASFWFDHCMISYSDKPFSGKLEEVSWSCSMYDIQNSTSKMDKIRFAGRLGATMNGLVAKATDEQLVISKNFATRLVRLNRFEYLYAMGQCTWDLTASDCNRCLSMAIDLLQRLAGTSSNAKVFYSSCMVRYETMPAFKTLKLSQSRPSLAKSK